MSGGGGRPTGSSRLGDGVAQFGAVCSHFR